jgi:hypothetical protein
LPVPPGIRGLGFAIPQQISQELVGSPDGLEEVANPCGFGSYFLCGQVGGDGVDELGGAADAFGGE